MVEGEQKSLPAEAMLKQVLYISQPPSPAAPGPVQRAITPALCHYPCIVPPPGIEPPAQSWDRAVESHQLHPPAGSSPASTRSSLLQHPLCQHIPLCSRASPGAPPAPKPSPPQHNKSPRFLADVNFKHARCLQVGIKIQLLPAVLKKINKSKCLTT